MMPNIIESAIREAFNIPREVQLNNADTEAQWKSFCELNGCENGDKQTIYITTSRQESMYLDELKLANDITKCKTKGYFNFAQQLDKTEDEMVKA